MDVDEDPLVSETFCGHVSDDESFFLKRCANGSDAARESPADFLFFFAFALGWKDSNFEDSDLIFSSNKGKVSHPIPLLTLLIPTFSFSAFRFLPLFLAQGSSSSSSEKGLSSESSSES